MTVNPQIAQASINGQGYVIRASCVQQNLSQIKYADQKSDSHALLWLALTGPPILECFPVLSVTQSSFIAHC